MFGVFKVNALLSDCSTLLQPSCYLGFFFFFTLVFYVGDWVQVQPTKSTFLQNGGLVSEWVS